jgi:hypothetical protein
MGPGKVLLFVSGSLVTCPVRTGAFGLTSDSKHGCLRILFTKSVGGARGGPGRGSVASGRAPFGPDVLFFWTD